jgi:hypothetical protein
MNPQPPNQCKQPWSNIDTVGRQQEQSCRHSSGTWIFADPSFHRKQQWRQTEKPVQRLWHLLTVVIWSDEKAAAWRPCRHSSDTWSLQIQAFKNRNNEDRQPDASTLTLLEHRHHLKWEGSSNKPLPSLFSYIDLCRSKLIYASKRVEWSSKPRIIRVESRLVRDPDFVSEIHSLLLAILPAVPEPRLVSMLWTYVENEIRRIGKGKSWPEAAPLMIKTWEGFVHQSKSPRFFQSIEKRSETHDQPCTLQNGQEKGAE